MPLELSFYRDEIFENTIFSGTELEKIDFDTCHFNNCIFTNVKLTNTNFSECIFEECDLSNAFLTGTSIQECEFKKCKMLGLKFEACNPILLSFYFYECQLNFSSFYGLKITGTQFINCNLGQTDFTETELIRSVFKNCNLEAAIFDHTILEGADLETAYNFSLDPENNNIRKATFSASNISGLLNKYDIKLK